MTPEKLFHELLGLCLNWQVTESRFERESGTVFLQISEAAELWESIRCPQDGGRIFCYDHTEVLSWRKGHEDLTVFADLIGKRPLCENSEEPSKFLKLRKLRFWIWLDGVSPHQFVLDWA